MLSRRLCHAFVAVAAAAAATMLVALPCPAYADGAVGSVDCRQDPTNPACTVAVTTPDAPGSAGTSGVSTCHDGIGRTVPCYVAGAGWLSDDGCYYQPATGADLAAAETLGGPVTPPGQWYVGQCGYPPVAGVTRFRVFAAPPGPEVLAAQAVKALKLPLPAIRVNPAPPAAQLVYLPTWLWLDESSWGSRSATASVPGLSVTATAKPSRLVFSTDDGATVTCPGPGTAWTAGKDPNAASPTCGHTYTRPGTYTLTATVTWQVGWAGGGRTGAVPDLTTTSTVTLNVTESQALNTNTQG